MNHRAGDALERIKMVGDLSITFVNRKVEILP